ncbi:MAG: hypothetical protein GF383_05855 [Candidatus Lokiarchaeota archaeon]|nr:hypothetical protein [Candidatus Lokiarchaeota archaeon]MBD3339456.1 hypothetical protein [Candidatus Lokiarchaeota archaeon]
MAKKKTTTKKKKTTKKTEAKEAPKEEPPKPKQIIFKKIRVNFWRTRLHAEELGVYQSLKYQAKTPYFAKNFDIEGVVEIDDEKKYIVAFNKDQWDEERNRLVIRLFTIMEEKMGAQKGGNFKGGVEMSFAHSIVQSFEIRHPAPVFFVQLPTNSFMPRIVKGYRFIGTRWSFPLLPEEKGDKLQMVLCKGKIGVGRDYDILIGKKKVARVDMQRVTKDVEMEIYDENLAKDKTFIMTLTLFGCICYFMKDAEKAVKEIVKPMEDTGTADFDLSKYELDLFKNPRMIRR